MKRDKSPTTRSSSQDIDAFLGKARQLSSGHSKGRLIVAIDATASRQPSWDRACHLQAAMFDASEGLSGLAIQLVYYRGFNEFYALPWLNNSAVLRQKMLSVSCLGGHTQIKRVLRHALQQQRQQAASALVFIGDAFEDKLDDCAQLAGQLGLHQLPVFIFQEGYDPIAANAFEQIARLSNGAHCQFDDSSAQQLERLLATIAVYASGGAAALATLPYTTELTPQLLKRDP